MKLRNTEDLRIGFITSHISNSYQFESFQRELKLNGVYNLHIIIKKSNDEIILSKKLKDLGIGVYLLDGESFLKLIKSFFIIIKILQKEKINLVHTSLPYGNLLGQTAAVFCGIKNRVTTCENASWAYDYKSIKQWLIDKYTFIVARKVISTSFIANKFLLAKWKVNPKKLTQINHAVVIEDYQNIDQTRINNIKHQIGIQPEDFCIGMIARTEFWKGHEYAIQAMIKLSGLIPKIKLFICGSKGFDHDKLEKLIESNNLENHVFFVGFLSDPIAFLHSVNVQLHIPINEFVENGGICIIEGMAAKVPQVLTLSGYAYQSAKNMINSLVVDYKNSDEVVKAISYVYSNPEKASELAITACRNAVEDYSIQNKLKKHIEVYTNW